VAASGCSEADNQSWQSSPAAARAMVEAGEEGLLPIQIVGLEQEFNTEAYDRIYENPFLLARDHPLSTFSIDVDTASYSNVRRFLENGGLPPPGAVRIEELINYFVYDYEPPGDETPFSAHVEVASCPWNPEHRLARIGLKGMEIEAEQRADANLVFLLDVSGSMNAPNKLPLLKSAMGMLVQNLSDRDRVSIVVYAGAAGVVIPPTSCEEKPTILAALDRLKGGGSTAGSEGIQLAYRVARENFTAESINRVILCTDGDFNVGVTNQGDLIRLIEEKAAEGVFLTCLGFGMGNYKDSTLEKLADKGNGNYAYIDTIHEARKVLVEQLGGTLVTIAKDVKIQVDFNPAQVGAYRLIGYENRMLRAEDFRDDTKDAGEIGAGHTVTALYELIPAGKEPTLPQAEPSKYQQTGQPTEAAASDELLTLRLRYKQPAAETSGETSFPVSDSGKSLDGASGDFQFAAAAACFGMLLRDSEHKGESTYDLVLELARSGRGEDPHGYRGEFVKLVELAESIRGRRR
jgi:Ca-activated chloride channel family protein